MRVLITGHTGFKGSWLSLMLSEHGYELYGYSLRPRNKGLFESTNLKRVFTNDIYADIRDRETFREFVTKIEPEVIIHLAAQPLVRYSYLNPIETFTTNVDGTRNVLEVSDEIDSVSHVLIITSDKVYRNTESGRAFKESDPLGGLDPYSASKSMSDLLAQSWGNVISKKIVLIARAGNVIGGGDNAQDRIVPDLVYSIQNNSIPIVRNPNSVRPWQHVLDCIHGYLTFLKFSVNYSAPRILNFGPNIDDCRTVNDLTKSFLGEFGLSKWKTLKGDSSPETITLALDSALALKEIGWTSHLDFENSVKWTANWYKEVFKGHDQFYITKSQVIEFLNRIST